MTQYVIDASVVLSWARSSNESDAQRHTVLGKIASGEIALIAPRFLLVEVVNVLIRKYGYTKKEVDTFLTLLYRIQIHFVDLVTEDINSYIDLMYRYNLTSYDAQYVRVALMRKCKLLSIDRALLQITDCVVSPYEL